jgi:hypothetical protein
MSFNRRSQIRCSPVMQKEDPLARSPERSRSKLIWTGEPLCDVIGKASTHVMH